ncbi:MAG: SCO family protein [Bdellovibrionales bacterium]|nr:SCO family protein [Bdellovibrionales bacterium]
MQVKALNFNLNTSKSWDGIGFVLLGWCFVFSALCAQAYDPSNVELSAQVTPKELEGVGLVDKTGDQLTLDLPFVDQDGLATSLGQILSTDGKPALLSVIYYGCPNLCNLHLDGVVAALKELNWTAGRDFHLVAVSMDPNEKPDLAKEKMANYMKEYGRSGMESGWHFLTGTEENIKKLTSQLGFSYRWNPEESQWAHSSSAYIITPQGAISRSLPGVVFDPKTLKMGIQEASNNRIGNIVDQLILYCYKFDPKKNKYTIYAFNIMRIAGLIAILAMGIFLVPAWVREGRRGKAV